MAVILMGAPLFPQVVRAAAAAPRCAAQDGVSPLGLLSMQHSACVAVDAHNHYLGHSMWRETWLWGIVKDWMLPAMPGGIGNAVHAQLMCKAVLQGELGPSR